MTWISSPASRPEALANMWSRAAYWHTFQLLAVFTPDSFRLEGYDPWPFDGRIEVAV